MLPHPLSSNGQPAPNNTPRRLVIMSAANSDDEDDDEVGELLESGTDLKPKVWRAAVVQEYKDNLIIRVCLEITESGEVLKMHEIFFRQDCLRCCDCFRGSHLLQVVRVLSRSSGKSIAPPTSYRADASTQVVGVHGL
jgi:hypothetical protein